MRQFLIGLVSAAVLFGGFHAVAQDEEEPEMPLEEKLDSSVRNAKNDVGARVAEKEAKSWQESARHFWDAAAGEEEADREGAAGR